MAGKNERVLKVVVAGDGKGGEVALDGVGKKADTTGGKFSKMSGVAKAASAAAGLAIVGFAKSSIEAYSEAEESQKKLEDAFQRFPKLADVNINALRSLDSELQKKTKYDDDVIASGQAVIAQFGLTGKQVQSVTPLLVDYASRTGKDVPAAAQDLGKALLGNAKALKNIGISYKATGDRTTDFNNITGLLRQQVGGFAEKEGSTTAGKLAILKNQFGELEETVGKKLIPVLTTLATVGLGLLNFFSNLPGPVKMLVVAAAALGVAVLVVNKAMQVWRATTEAWSAVTKVATVVQAAFNAVMDANPVVLVVIAIAALAAGLVLAYEKVGFFRAAVDAAFSFVRQIVSDVVGFVTQHWQLMVEILAGPIGLAVAQISAHWDALKQGFSNVVQWISTGIGAIVGFFQALPGRVVGFMSTLFDPLKNAATAASSFVSGKVSAIVSFFTGLPGKIKGAFATLADIIKSPFTSAFGAIKRLWNSTVGGFGFKVPGWIPGVGGKEFRIPSMAAGGIVQATPGGVVTLIGEAGSNEAVLPLTSAGLQPVVDAVREGLAGSDNSTPDFTYNPTGKAIANSSSDLNAVLAANGRPVPAAGSSGAVLAAGQSATFSDAYLRTLATGFTEDDVPTADEQRALDLRRRRGLPAVQDLYKRGQAGDASAMAQFNAQLAENQRLQRDGTSGVAASVASAYGITPGGDLISAAASSLTSAVADGVSSAIAGQQQITVNVNLDLNGAVVTDGIQALVDRLTPALRVEFSRILSRNASGLAITF